MNTNSQNDDKLFFHYTNTDSAIKIISTGLVWASHCRFLNDINELKVAENAFLQKIKTTYEIKVETLEKLKISRSGLGFFIFSLSSSEFLLSQWRSYGDDGRGLCLGFRPEFIEKSTLESKFIKNDENIKGVFLECVYDKHEEVINSLIEENYNILRDIINEADNNEFFLNDNASEKLKTIQIKLLTLKDKAFSEEKEHRLIMATSKRHSKMRVSNGIIVPYLEIRVFDDNKQDTSSDSAIPKIWLGPKCDDRNKMAIRMLGKTTWLLEGNVKKYDCGYR